MEHVLLITTLNEYFSNNIFNNQFWYGLEAIAGFLLLFGGILQRVYMTAYKSGSTNHYPWLTIKLAQIGLYIQNMLGLLCMVDGIQLLIYDDHGRVGHVFMTLWAIACFLMKIRIFQAAYDQSQKPYDFYTTIV